MMPENTGPLPGHQPGVTAEKPWQQITDTFGIGLLLWFIGYIASIILFFFVPASMIGWILFVLFTPLLIAVTFARFRKRSLPLKYYVIVAVTWTGIAIVADFFFIVLLFNPDNYYHASVLVYYLEMFLVPVITGILYRSEA
ncbi:MAG: hypothetical protein WCP36_04025 [Methanomicrobiales archaeon]